MNVCFGSTGVTSVNRQRGARWGRDWMERSQAKNAAQWTVTSRRVPSFDTDNHCFLPDVVVQEGVVWSSVSHLLPNRSSLVVDSATGGLRSALGRVVPFVCSGKCTVSTTLASWVVLGSHFGNGWLKPSMILLGRFFVGRGRVSAELARGAGRLCDASLLEGIAGEGGKKSGCSYVFFRRVAAVSISAATL